MLSSSKLNTISDNFMTFIMWASFSKTNKLSKIFDIFLRLFIQNSNVETNFNIKAVAMKQKLISDFFENIEVRGFENDRRPS